MKSYIAQIVYRIECDGGHTDQYEEQWRIVFADNQEVALHEAREAAKKDESTFVDRHGRTIFWHLLAVKDIQPVELVQGGLLFSVVREPELVPAPVWAA